MPCLGENVGLLVREIGDLFGVVVAPAQASEPGGFRAFQIVHPLVKLLPGKGARTLAGRLRLIAKMMTIIPLSLCRAVKLVMTEHTTLIALHPLLVAVGSLLAVVGLEPQPYKASKIAP